MWRRILDRGLHSGCAVLSAPIYIRSLYKNLSKMSLMAKSGDVAFCSETLVSSRLLISELMVPGFGRLMQLLRGEVDRFRGLWLYTCVMAFRRIGRVIMSVDVVTL